MSVTAQYAWLGRTEYFRTEELQRMLVEEVIASGDGKAFILGVEHPDVVTLGRSSVPSNLLLPPTSLRSKGVDVVESRRGGDVTWHGPGQAVIYPILPLRRLKPDVHWYLRMLEEAGIRTMRTYGIYAGRKPGLTGVWVGEEKAMAVGVAVRRWVTFHGAALNVNGGLQGFQWIVPCGIRDKGVTSIERLSDLFPSVQEVSGVFAGHLAETMGFNTVEIEEEVLWQVPSPPG